MVAWIQDFVTTYNSKSSRYVPKLLLQLWDSSLIWESVSQVRSSLSALVDTGVNTNPVIYSTTDWWTTCTGNSAAFAGNSPLWIARYASTVGTLPAGWEYVR